MDENALSELRNFGVNNAMTSAVKASLEKYLSDTIVKRTFDGHDVTGYKQARDVFNSWLLKLQEELAPKEIPKSSEYSDGE